MLPWTHLGAQRQRGACGGVAGAGLPAEARATNSARTEPPHVPLRKLPDLDDAILLGTAQEIWVGRAPLQVRRGARSGGNRGTAPRRCWLAEHLARSFRRPPTTTGTTVECDACVLALPGYSEETWSCRGPCDPCRATSALARPEHIDILWLPWVDEEAISALTGRHNEPAAAGWPEGDVAERLPEVQGLLHNAALNVPKSTNPIDIARNEARRARANDSVLHVDGCDRRADTVGVCATRQQAAEFATRAPDTNVVTARHEEFWATQAPGGVKPPKPSRRVVMGQSPSACGGLPPALEVHQKELHEVLSIGRREGAAGEVEGGPRPLLQRHGVHHVIQAMGAPHSLLARHHVVRWQALTRTRACSLPLPRGRTAMDLPGCAKRA